MDNKNSMRVSRLHGIRDLRLEEATRPAPGPDEVLLRVASVGTCGSDVHYYVEGRIGDQIVTDPIVMGHEFSAWVAELDLGVRDLEVGQLVAVEPAISCGVCEHCLHGHPNICPNVIFCGTPPVDGVFGEYTIMPAENCFPLPEGFTADEGAMLEPLGIAIHAVDLSHLKPGQTIAVLGAGPIGLLVAAVAKAAGAGAIYVTEPQAHRRQFALEYVADAALNPDDTDVVAEIVRMTDGAAAMVRPGGKVIVAGIPSSDKMTFTASTTRRKGLTIKMVRRMKHTYPRAIRMVERGMVDVKALVTHTFSLERIADAFELVAGYDDGVLRAVIRVAEQ